MTTPAVHVEHLRKTYVVPEREGELRASIKSLVRRRSREVKAVDDISFRIGPGETVAIVGQTARAKPPRSKCCRACCTPVAARRVCSILRPNGATNNF